MKPPAFQFYVDDFIGGVSTMTQSEVGAYILLLCHQWQSGKISDDKTRIEMVARGPVSEHVLEKFPSGKNRRLEVERRKQREYREKQAINGAKGGRPAKPKPNPSHSFGLSQIEPKKSSPSPVSSLQSSIKEEEKSALDFCETPSWEDFLEFCLSPQCGVVEWFARDKFLAQDAKGWHQIRDWRKYALRVRGWWDNEGRPMTPPKKNGQQSSPVVHHLRDMVCESTEDEP